MQQVLRQYYQRASSDGSVQAGEVQQACQICGVNIDAGTAAQLLMKVAGRDRRVSETEFASGIYAYVNNILSPQLRQFFQRSCADGMLQLAEIQQCVGMFGVQIDLPTAQQVLMQIAGRDQRVTENEFVSGIQGVVAQRKFAMLPPKMPQMMGGMMPQQLMPGMMPQMQMNPGMMPQMQMQMNPGMMPQMQMNPGMMQMNPGMMQMNPGMMQQQQALPYLAGQGMMGGLTPEQAQLKQYFYQACADGMIQAQEVQTACQLCGVQIDLMTAQQLTQQIAGADRRITELEFVTGIANFCQQRKQMMMGGMMMGMPGGMMPMMPM